MNRYKIRENVFKLLFLKEFYDTEEMDEQTELYFEREEFENLMKEDKSNLVLRYNSVMEVVDSIDGVLNEISDGWSVDRMGKVELSILRLAVYEIKYDDSVPDSVAINEAVELAKKYGQDESFSFINGILAKLV